MDKLTERLTKDLNGYTDYFNAELDTLIGKRVDELAPLYRRLQKSAVEKLDSLNKDIASVPEAKRKSKQYIAKMQKAYVTHILPDLELAAAAQDPYVTEVLAGTVEYGYYTQAYSLEQAAKVAVNVPILNRSGVLGLIANDWVGDGHTYSDRIRANTALVAEKSTEVIKDLVTKRQSYTEAAHSLADKIDESYNNAARIVRTEMTRANALGTSYAAMANADILDGKYRDAVYDARTSSMCAADADYSVKHPYPLDYDTPANPGIPGKRIPNHPNCRCCWRNIVSAVGVMERQKIARKNDSKNSYGENYYTEAQSYDSYAKERGIPSVKEMLERDNPRRYLRPGETIDSLKKRVKRVKFGNNTITVSRAPWANATTVTNAALAKTAEGAIINMGTLSADFGEEYATAIEERLKAAPANIRAVWNNYVDRYTVLDAKHSGTACYSPTKRGIKIDIASVSRDRSLNFGTDRGIEVYKKAYGTLYHEMGHHTASLYAIDNGFNAWDDVADLFISKKHAGKTLTAMLQEEGTERIKLLEKTLKEAFKKHTTDYDWLHDHGFIGDFDYDWYKKYGQLLSGPPKYSKSVVYTTMSNEIKGLPAVSTNDISDMWDGITNGKVVGFSGHTFADKQYWKSVSVGSEAFAEMFDASINNPASLEQIKHYFPKSYEIFTEIIKELGGL